MLDDSLSAFHRPSQRADLSIHNAVDIVESYYRCLAGRDRDGLKRLLDPGVEVIYHGPAGAFPWVGKFQGMDGFERFLAAVAGCFEIVRMERLNTYLDGAAVITVNNGCWRVRENNNEINATLVNIFTMANDRIGRIEFFNDTLAFARGVGHPPPS